MKIHQNISALIPLLCYFSGNMKMFFPCCLAGLLPFLKQIWNAKNYYVEAAKCQNTVFWCLTCSAPAEPCKWSSGRRGWDRRGDPAVSDTAGITILRYRWRGCMIHPIYVSNHVTQRCVCILLSLVCNLMIHSTLFCCSTDLQEDLQLKTWKSKFPSASIYLFHCPPGGWRFCVYGFKIGQFKCFFPSQ